MGTASSAVQSHKLTPEQTKVISSLAFHLRITGMVISAPGLLLCVVAGLFSVTGLGGISAFITGVLLIRTAGSFQQFSASETYDIVYLMEALTNLRNAYRLITAMMIIILIVYLGITLYIRWLS